MTSQNHIRPPVDVWDQLHTVFEGTSEHNPEIHLVNMKADEMTACILYLLRHSRDFISQFVIPGTDVVVAMRSPQKAVSALIDGRAVAAFWIGFPGLPTLAVYVDEPHVLSVSYMRGEWTALTVLGLFDLLHHLTILAPSADVYPDAVNFTDDERKRFREVFQQYQNALS